MDKIQEAFEHDSKYLDYTPGDNRTYKDDDTQMRWLWYKRGYTAAKAEPVDPWRCMSTIAIDEDMAYRLNVTFSGRWKISNFFGYSYSYAKGYNADPSRDGETRKLVDGEWVEVESDD